MAKYSGSTFGTIRKKIGEAVGTTWKGIKVVRSLAASVSNPRTEAQQAQRSRLSGAVAVYRLLSSVIQLGFREMAIRQTEANAFTSANIMSAFTPNAPNPAIVDYALLKVSKGSIPPTLFTQGLASVSSNEIPIEWPSNNAGSGQSGTDQFNAVVVNTTTGETCVQLNVGTRSSGGAPINAMPPNFFAPGNNLRVIGFFSNVAGDKASDSTTTTGSSQA